jgi:hypothetical protein
VIWIRGQPANRALQDFFYICVSHLSDRGFASPVVDAEAEAAKKKKELMDKEIEKVKQEYEEKQRKKKAKKKSKDDDKDKKKDDEDEDKAEKERDDKVSGISSSLPQRNCTGIDPEFKNSVDQSHSGQYEFQRQARGYCACLRPAQASAFHSQRYCPLTSAETSTKCESTVYATWRLRSEISNE